MDFNTYMIMLVLVVLNALNTGGYAFFGTNYVNRFLGRDYSRYFYMAVGMAALVLAYRMTMDLMPRKEEYVM